MKKLTLSFAFLFLLLQLSHAQDVSSFLKKAKKSFDKYQQSDEDDKLEEALGYIKNAVYKVDKENDKLAAKVWMKAGEIYNEIALNDYKIFLVNNNHLPIHPYASAKAYEAFQNTVKTADKKWDKSKALDELLKTATFISNEGIVAYNIESYEKAYHSFQTIIEIRDFLNHNEHVSILNKKKEYHQHLFKTALAAKKANHPQEALDYFEKLKEENFKNPVVYSKLYDLYSATDKQAKALTALKDGRTLFPEDEGLMIAEINHYLNKGQLNELTDKLETAIRKNPNNVSLYSTLGHVYNELQKAEADKGNFNLSSSYFEQSMSYFVRALEVNDTYGPALYNIGALYFNNAAIITKEIKSFETDMTANGIRKSNAKHSEMMGLLDKALPYFQKAEAVNPNDAATLGALAEIYTRKNDATLADEFKSRLEKVESGQEIETGYFGG